jgi:hypothetical protein
MNTRLDATVVRAHPHSVGARKKNGGDQAIGRSRGGLTTKIHALVDALGNPVASWPSQKTKPTRGVWMRTGNRVARHSARLQPGRRRSRQIPALG